MPILVDTDSEEAKERRKWEQFPSVYGPPGNPYVMRPFPAMMYRAQRVPAGFPRQGAWATGLSRPSKHGFRNTDEWDAACQEVELFSRSCQRIVNNEAEYKRAKDEGWSDSPVLALEQAEKEWKAVSDAAAHRAYEDRNMSEAAKAEASAVEADTFGHVPEIPEKPKRRGRKPAASAA